MLAALTFAPFVPVPVGAAEPRGRKAAVADADAGRSDGPGELLDAAMDRYAAGDDAAFEAVYDGLAPRLYGFLLRQTRDRARAEDVVQQTMLQIHRARGRFTPGAQVVPWAFAIARRLLIDQHRRGGREVLSPTDDDVGELLVALDASADDVAIAKELAMAAISLQAVMRHQNQRSR